MAAVPENVCDEGMHEFELVTDPARLSRIDEELRPDPTGQYQLPPRPVGQLTSVQVCRRCRVPGPSISVSS